MFKPERLTLINFLTHESSVFEFRQNKAVLVVGRNLDQNSGQKGNGAGKSSLNEAIALCISGETIRNGKTREFVRRGEEESEIELLLYNTKTKKHLLIYRKIFSKQSKSSVCRIWEDKVRSEDTEIKTCPDINSYNAFILSQLEITKDDFFNFFVITKERYQAFLSTGDAKKKEIINRFSGAQTVDKIDPLVKADVKKLEEEIQTLERELIRVQTKSGVIYEQIQKEKEEKSEAKLQEQINEKLLKITELEENKVSYFDQIKTFETTIQNLENEREPLVDKYEEIEANLVVKNTDISLIQHKQQELNLSSSNVAKKFQKEIDDINSTDKEINETLELFKLKLRSSKSTKESLENQLIGLITCPKCEHEFSLKNKELKPDEVRVLIQEVEKSILETQKEITECEELLVVTDESKQDVNKRIIAERELIKKEILEYDQLNTQALKERREIQIELNDQEVSLNAIARKIKETQTSIESNNYQVQNITNVITNYKNAIEELKKTDNSKLTELESQFNTLQEDEIKQKEFVDWKKEELTETNSWVFNFKSFKSHLANQSIKSISDYTNFFLQSIGSNIQIEIEGYKTLSDGRVKEEIVTTVLRDGFQDGSYGMFSAGERGRIEICNILALQQLINLNCQNGGLDLLICDEVLDSVDSYGLELIVNSLQILQQTIMIVSQNEINNVNDSTIVIEKENKISKIL